MSSFTALAHRVTDVYSRPPPPQAVPDATSYAIRLDRKLAATGGLVRPTGPLPCPAPIMSPVQPRIVRRLSNISAGREFESSNSTAYKFLGATRRSWMLGATFTNSSNSTSGSARAQESTQNASRPLPAASEPPPGQLTAGAAGRTSQVLSQAPTLPTGRSSVTTATSDVAPVSPITPSEKLHKAEGSSSNSPPVQTITAEPPPPTAAASVSQDSILPSPEPSNGSRTSPASVADADNEELRCVDAAAPLALRPGLAQSPQPAKPAQRSGANTAAVTKATDQNTPLAGCATPQGAYSSFPDPAAHGDKRPRLNISCPPPNPASMPLSGGTAHSDNRAHGSSPSTPQISPGEDMTRFWGIALGRIRVLLASCSGMTALSETVELPRVRLLQDACEVEDMFYLALHQVYSLHSFAPSEFARLDGFGMAQKNGFEVVKQLIVDNKRLSGDFLKWCVHFPFSLHYMLQTERYRNVLQQVRQCLALMYQRWSFFEQEIRNRSYPPLIDELVLQFGATSSVLQSIIFTALARRISGPDNEPLMKQFQAIFDQNRQNYVRRFADPRSPIPPEQMQRENEALVAAYKSLSAQPAAAAHQPSPLATGVRQHATQIQPQSVPQNTARVSSPTSRVLPRQITPAPTPGYLPQSSHPPNVQVPAQIRSPVYPQMPPQTPGPPAPTPQVSSGYPASTIPSRLMGVHPNPFVTQNQPASQVQFRHYAPPPYGSMALPMPSQLAASSMPQTTAAPATAGTTATARRRGRPPRTTQAYQAGGPNPAATVGSSPGVNQHYQVFNPDGFQAVRMLNTAPPMTLASPTNPQARPHSLQKLDDTPLLPPPGHCPINTPHPNPNQVALHQAHLRSPPRQLIRQGADGAEEAEFFQYLRSFAVAPTFLGQHETAFTWKFSVSSEDRGKFPRDLPSSGPGQRPVRVYSDGSLTYRLRCIQIPPSCQDISEESWSVTESVWPSVIYIHVNEVELFVRRKVHNGKDLPLDITGHLKEGENVVTLRFLRSPPEYKDLLYAMAVEILEISGFDSVKKLVGTLPASESQEQIQKRLSLGTGDDDELAVVNDYITIDLVDPFMARIFDIPARGRTCLHQECFDLDTFIKTRVSKSGKGKMREDWKCPICGRDARPKTLVIDGFLVEVHAELKRTNRLEQTKAILVRADGSWEPKVEKDAAAEGGGRGSTKRKFSEFESDLNNTAKTTTKAEGGGSGNGTSTSTPRRQQPEVIELD